VDHLHRPEHFRLTSATNTLISRSWAEIVDRQISAANPSRPSRPSSRAIPSRRRPRCPVPCRPRPCRAGVAAVLPNRRIRRRPARARR
jgi:hypothetical protein